MLPLPSRPFASCLLRATNIVAFEPKASVGLETPLTTVVRAYVVGVYVGGFGVGDAAANDPPHDPSRSARSANLRIRTAYARSKVRHLTSSQVTLMSASDTLACSSCR